MAFFLFLFFQRLGLAYGALNIFTFAQGQEASEFDQPRGKTLFRAIKIILMTLTLFNFAPTLSIAVFLSSVYAAHAFYLSQFDENANRTYYNQYLRRFWQGFSLLTIGSLLVNPMALGLVAAGAFPFIVKELKLIVPPMSRFGYILHHFDDHFSKWASLASLVILPTTLIHRLLNYFIVAINVYQPIMDNISYVTHRLFSLNVMRALSAVYRFHYMPNIVKNAYNLTLGRLHDELEAFFDYYNRPETTVSQMQEAIASGNVAQLRPAVENLYKGRPRKVFIPGTDIGQSAEQAGALLSRAIDIATESEPNFNALLAQMAQKSPSWKNTIDAVALQEDKDALYAVMRLYATAAGNYREQFLSQNQNIQEVVTIIVDNVQTLRQIIANPRVQGGADNVPGTSDKIPSGLAALLTKFVSGMTESGEVPLRNENNARRQELLNRASYLMASIFDTSLRCQNALHGLIQEETQQDFVHEPLIASWGDYVNQQIAGAQERLVTAFTREVAYDPNGQWDENIQRQLGVRVNLGYVVAVNAFFSFDPQNVDHQRIVASRFLPQQMEHETFRAFSSVSITRHTDLYELCPYYIGTSFFQHLLYPTLFSAYTVEEMIARTQEVYANARITHEAGTALPSWVERWDTHWQTYLNTAYPAPQVQELPNECDSQALFNAYIEHQENDQRALRMYDPALNDEDRAAMLDEGNIGLVGAAKMQALWSVVEDNEHFPAGFDDWTDVEKRHYLQMDKSMVTGADLYSDLVEQAASDNRQIAAEAEINGQRCFVAREFALVVLFSEGLVTHEHPLHQKIGELGIISRFMNPEDKLKRLGYTN